MEFGWFHDDEESLSELNITPLVDVALVLLIIFMITAPMLVQGANIDLPQTRPMDKLPGGSVFITITADGEIFMNDEEAQVPIEELESRIAPLAQLGQAVFVKADRSATVQHLADVFDAAKGAGAEVNFITEPRTQSR